MNNNITPDMLIQYLDNELEPAARLSVEEQLSADPALQQQLERLRLAKQAFLQYARKQHVSAIHAELLKEGSLQSKPAGKLHWLRRTMRLVAILLVLILIGGIIQYSLLDADRLYDSQYEAFTLGTTRAGATVSSLEQAYRQNNLQDVIGLYEATASRTPTDHFIAGQAYLAGNDPHKAIAAFEAQLSANASLPFKPYEEDAEYYLALAYLKAGDITKALPLFESIYRRPAHAYHNEVSGWYLSKLRWLKRKQSK